jgi:site-specific DNA-methyltransferase (adenine-specific)
MSNINLMQGDCLERMKEIPDGSVDMILTDPPYSVITGGSNVNKKGAPKGILTNNKQLMKNIPNFNCWLNQCYRVLKMQTHAYFMTNTKNLAFMMSAAEQAGFYIHNVLIWKKNNATPNKWYMKNCEYIIFCSKGKAKFINNCGSKTVHEFNNPRNKIHPTEKPLELMKLYVLNSSGKGDIILDPFMGSGTTGVAAKNLNRSFIGIELDETYFNIAKERIDLTTVQGALL